MLGYAFFLGGGGQLRISPFSKVSRICNSQFVVCFKEGIVHVGILGVIKQGVRVWVGPIDLEYSKIKYLNIAQEWC